MKKISFTIVLVFAMLIATNVRSQEVELSLNLHSSGYNSTGEWYEIFGEVTNNSGKMVKGVSVNVNYYDASGKKLEGSNFIDPAFKNDFSDSQPVEGDYLAKGASAPFQFIRFSDKISGKVAKVEVKITGVVTTAPTCAVVENFNAVKSEDVYKVSGNFKCTGGTVYNCRVALAGFNSAGKIIKVDHVTVDKEKETDSMLKSGQSMKFSGEIYGIDGVVKVKAYPYYRGDWNED